MKAKCSTVVNEISVNLIDQPTPFTQWANTVINQAKPSMCYRPKNMVLGSRFHRHNEMLIRLWSLRGAIESMSAPVVSTDLGTNRTLDVAVRFETPAHYYGMRFTF